MIKMDISHESESDDFPSRNYNYGENNLFLQKDRDFYNFSQMRDYSFNTNLEDRINPLCYSENEDSIGYNQRRGNLFNCELSNINNDYYNTLFTNSINSNTNKGSYLNELEDKKTKTRPLFEIKKDEMEEIKDIPPEYFPEDTINDIIKQLNISDEMKFASLLDINNKNSDIEKVRNVLESDKIKRTKKINDISYRSDNILSKIINLINLSLLNFINKIRDKDLKEVIKNNDYEFRYELTKKDEKLKLLNWTLKDYFSVNISSKFKYPINYNKLVIEKLLEEKNNKDVFEFILNDLLIADCLEIFLYKKDLKDIDKFNSLNDTKKDMIEKSFERIDKYINDKYINKFFKYDKNYFHCFILIIYNLKRYLINKEARNRIKKEKKEEN